MQHRIHRLSAEETDLSSGDYLRSILSGAPSARSLENINPQHCLFFDIETTGLSSDTSFVFLIGCICSDGTSWYLHQFFIRMVQEEKELLSSFMKLAEKYQVLIHFNGNTFDLPFLRGRAAENHLEEALDDFVSIDLYQHFRPLRKKLHLPHMNQSFLEKQAGWIREDTLSGKDVVTHFWTYAAAGQPETEQLLLNHNRDDLTGMLHVLRLEAYMALFSGRIASNVSVEEPENPAFLTLRFQLQLTLPKALEQSFDMPDGRQCLLHADTVHGRFRIPFLTGTLQYFLPDYKDYFYLPVEKQVIHKSVAAYVAKEYREKAKPETCFVTKNGRFLPLPPSKFQMKNSDESRMLARPPFTPVFRKSYTAKEQYFEYETDFGQDPEAAVFYTKLLLCRISYL